MQYYTEPFSCSYEDKLHCIETVKKLYDLAILVRKKGLLILYEAMENESDLFFKKSLYSLLELLEYEQVSNCLYAYLAAGNYHGRELLKNLLIVNGVLLILNNTHPTLVMSCLKGWFGEEFAEIYDLEMNM